MTANVPLVLVDPFSPRHHNVDLNSVKDFAAERELPMVLQQRRDDQGQFLSRRDVPGQAAATS